MEPENGLLLRNGDDPFRSILLAENGSLSVDLEDEGESGGDVGAAASQGTTCVSHASTPPWSPAASAGALAASGTALVNVAIASLPPVCGPVPVAVVGAAAAAAVGATHANAHGAGPLAARRPEPVAVAPAVGAVAGRPALV